MKRHPAGGLTPLAVPDLDVIVNGKPIRPSFHIEPLEPGDPVPNVARWLGRFGMDAALTSRLTARGQLRFSGPYTPIGEPGIETQSYAVVDLGTSIELPGFGAVVDLERPPARFARRSALPMTSNRARPYPEDDFVRTFTRKFLMVVPTAVLGGMLWGCGSDEQQAVLPDHTPTRYSLIMNNVPVAAPYKLKTNAAFHVQIKFFNKEDEDLDDVESEHFGGLRLSPGQIGSVTRVSDRHYQFDILTGPNAVEGTLQVSFGHDEQADEVTFDPEPVTVAGGGLQ